MVKLGEELALVQRSLSLAGLLEIEAAISSFLEILHLSLFLIVLLEKEYNLTYF